MPDPFGYNIVCISHLRWDFVWQRPQHLLSRLAREHRIIFVEEPVAVAAEEQQRLDGYVWTGEQGEQVLVLRLLQPVPEPRWIGHGDPQTAETYQDLIAQELRRLGVDHPVLWLYTPMADGFIAALDPAVLVYDVMDQLSAFKGAPAELKDRDRAILGAADIVFTGGVSLYRDKAPYNANTHLFPSGVDVEHFAGRGVQPPADVAHLPSPVIGYFGVIDERMDLDLLAEIAAAHPEWSLVMIGPVVKIDPGELPQAHNLRYLGGRPYAELPAYLAQFDVALVPFALSEATRYLSPTKTLEYMAAHKPIVSTAIHDVIELYGAVVRVGHSHAEFIAHVEGALAAQLTPEQLAQEDALLEQHRWRTIAAEMAAIIGSSMAQAMPARLEQIAESK